MGLHRSDPIQRVVWPDNPSSAPCPVRTPLPPPVMSATLSPATTKLIAGDIGVAHAEGLSWAMADGVFVAIKRSVIKELGSCAEKGVYVKRAPFFDSRRGNCPRGTEETCSRAFRKAAFDNLGVVFDEDGVFLRFLTPAHEDDAARRIPLQKWAEDIDRTRDEIARVDIHAASQEGQPRTPLLIV